MKLRRALRPLVVGVAGVIVAGTLTAVPAEAASSEPEAVPAEAAGSEPGTESFIIRYFKFRTCFEDCGGEDAARLKGHITWYGKRRFDVIGTINDLCGADGSGDGWGAVGVISIFYVRGDWTEHHLPGDVDGCRSDPENFAKRFYRERRVTDIWLTVCERKYPGLSCTTRYKDNPYTAISG